LGLVRERPSSLPVSFAPFSSGLSVLAGILKWGIHPADGALVPAVQESTCLRLLFCSPVLTLPPDWWSSFPRLLSWLAFLPFCFPLPSIRIAQRLELCVQNFNFRFLLFYFPPPSIHRFNFPFWALLLPRLRPIPLPFISRHPPFLTRTRESNLPSPHPDQLDYSVQITTIPSFLETRAVLPLVTQYTGCAPPLLPLIPF